MKLFIPPLGTKLMLMAPWVFKLHYESRNRRLWDLMFAPPEMERFPTIWKETYQDARLTYFEAGTQLTVDRIHIRKGLEGYNSVTFKGRVNAAPGVGPLYSVRFWVSLDDANKMNIKVIN
jgi:hypothetical protein